MNVNIFCRLAGGVRGAGYQGGRPAAEGPRTALLTGLKSLQGGPVAASFRPGERQAAGLLYQHHPGGDIPYFGRAGQGILEDPAGGQGELERGAAEVPRLDGVLAALAGYTSAE